MVHFDDLDIGTKFKFKGYPQEHIKYGDRLFYATWEKRLFDTSLTWEIEPGVLLYKDLKAGDMFSFTYSEYDYIKTDDHSFVDLESGEITLDDSYFRNEEVERV